MQPFGDDDMVLEIFRTQMSKMSLPQSARADSECLQTRKTRTVSTEAHGFPKVVSIDIRLGDVV